MEAFGRRLIQISWSRYLFCLFVCFCFVALGFELRAYILSHSTSPFLGFFEIGFHKLFAQAGFECNPPELCFLS
jgi:hypothetical protein